MPTDIINDTESLKLSLLSYQLRPTVDAAMDLVDQIMAQPEPIPAQVFDLLSACGRSAALVSWIGYHMENAAATTFQLPSTGREW